ncbi:unnamed protein product [Urochloa decumbens]|uniref:Uncharacterized protein n=1 Tax=Urochloa decumbens TaxID=240449 RepID=A0ABC9FAN7_9POAL
MFLTDKYSSLLPPHHHHSDAAPPKSSNRRRQQQQAGKAACFDAALAARLRGLLPLPGPACSPSSSSRSRSRRRRARSPARVTRPPSPRTWTPASRSSTPATPSPRASSASAAAASSPASRSTWSRRRSASPPPQLPSLPFDQPRGRLSAAARVLVAVNTVSSLAAAAAVLGGDALGTAFSRVSGSDFPWAEPFNAVSSQLSTLAICNASEVDAIDEAVQRLASVLDGKGGADEAALGAAAQEVERRTEELTARLDRLSDAVNGVFRAALGLRNAELGAFVAGPAGKTCV